MLRMLEFSCREVTEAADEYLEGRLGRWRRYKLRLHLRICEHCRRYLRQIERTVGMLRELPATPPAPATAAMLVDAFRQRHAGKTASTPPPDRV